MPHTVRFEPRLAAPKITAAMVCTLAVLLLARATAAAPARPQRAADVPVERCLTALARGGAPRASKCPGFLVAPLTAALTMCRGAGGKLVAARAPEVWELDVDGDGRNEYALDYDGIVACDGAPSVFSCGSRACPKVLFEERADRWRPIGELYAPSIESVVLGDATNDGYRDIDVGCGTGGAGPCAEVAHYRWRNPYYVRVGLDANGFPVDLENSKHGVYPLAADTTVLATPAKGAAKLARYAAGTEVAIVGTAEKADYYYVSPCNACARGFVPKSALRLDGPR